MGQGPQPGLTLQETPPELHHHPLSVYLTWLFETIGSIADTIFSSADLYIMSLTIVGSILIYPAGNLDYIDALFFGSGCATQSGLNTLVARSLDQVHLADHRVELISTSSIRTNRLIYQPLKLDGSLQFAGCLLLLSNDRNPNFHQHVRGLCAPLLV